VVADRAEGADQEFHDGRVHRRQIAKIQAARFRQQRMQSIHRRKARARKRIERPAPDGKANAVIEAGNLDVTESRRKTRVDLSFESPVSANQTYNSFGAGRLSVAFLNFNL
jgi:hypothetical protein